MARVATNGKHFALDDLPYRVRGVTYGSFKSRPDGYRFPDRHQMKADLSLMNEAGLNTLRTYALPPVELLEIAEEMGLRILVGLNYYDWRLEPETGYWANKRIRQYGRQAVLEAMELCTGHPAVLGIAVGNEIPVDLVRLHRAQAVQEVLAALVAEVHAADPNMLATYVNFPTTEFLEVEGQDFISFNVFLERPDQLARYLTSLQLLAAGKPLLVTELGLASEVHGEASQQASLDWQLRATDEAGCGGATVFSWTDEWAVADEPVTGWGFGLTTEERAPKPALGTVARWAGSTSPIDLRPVWPRISVIVCAYNEENTIEECLASLAACNYPDLEVIVCDDGSTDRTLEIAGRFPFKILELPHGGLSVARNAGLEAAGGEIVAYLDADAACHPDWPFYLALSMEEPTVVATGGPNLPHPDAGLIERAVAESPGSPMEVLLAPDRAEHVPGCNMAFRREHLVAIGGFNPAFTSAGDDVDVCWKLLDEGHEIGFAPAAEVIHHRRATVMGYLRQQRGYGRAEAMLSGPHRHRFNRLGQARWLGFVYGGSRVLPSLLRPMVYTGYMGMAPFQPIVQRRAELVGAWATALLPLMIPLLVVGLALSLVSTRWLVLPAALTVLAISYGLAVSAALRVDHKEPHPRRLRAMVGLLHILQPPARVWGRISGKKVGPPLQELPTWVGDRYVWLEGLKRALETGGCTVRVGPPGNAWDLEARTGLMIIARITTAVVWRWEPRYRLVYRPRLLFWGLNLVGFLGLLGGSALGWVFIVSALLGLGAGSLNLRSRVRRAISRSTIGSAS